MHALDVLGHPVRRRVLELLLDGERSSGDVVAVIREEFDLSQPAVSQHLRLLRESGFALARVDGARRLYSIGRKPMEDVDDWLRPFHDFWSQRLDALGTELARGRRARVPREKRDE